MSPLVGHIARRTQRNLYYGTHVQYERHMASATRVFRLLCPRLAVRARQNRIMPISGHPRVPCARAIYKETLSVTKTPYPAIFPLCQYTPKVTHCAYILTFPVLRVTLPVAKVTTMARASALGALGAHRVRAWEAGAFLDHGRLPLRARVVA